MTDDEDPRHEYDRISIALEREHRGDDTPESNIEILARCDVLWSGWECDYTVVLYRVISTGEVDLHVVAGVSHLGDAGPIALLQERLEAYRKAITETEAFLERVVKEAPELAGNPDNEAAHEEMRDMEEATRMVKETRREMRKRPWKEDETPPWRWACTECWTEGPGGEPEACPTCGCTDAWYVTAAHGGRPLQEVFENLFARSLGTPPGRTKH